ncbi:MULTISPECIES: DUF805 domain-containing protein [unclassified Butyrivibrio]|uniref:DUF805 domain-containing protein n=1 Tax=unclassified Butyrivibrio TaxID=2639466 RepID=UPI0003B2EF63|nr:MULTISPECIES: DUF805 domain-containing protein [unclassified Butyrivibrio]MDC7292291.1 DUF805 domain-containing protein [Butyrivibrio sp. DSM 10294]
MSFVDAIKSVFSQYANFSGRARRSEYWYYVLCYAIISIVINLLSQASSVFAIVGTVVGLALICPTLAVEIRRLHDIGKSGWYLLFNLIPLVGAIILLVWFCKDSEPGDNMYGPNPKGIGGFQQPMM